jgi:Ca2+/Na+ antiporter
MAISDTVAGITLLAVGSALPDFVTSIIFVKKRGFADMAICGAIASNRFAILVGLGFPWIIKCIFNWIKNQSFFLNSVVISGNSLPYTSLVLLTAIVLLFINFKFNDWTLNRKFAICCLLIYSIFVTIAIHLEYAT